MGVYKRKTALFFKRFSILLLTVTLCFSLAACGKSEAAQQVDDQIAALGTIDLNSGDKITDAEDAVSTLEQKDQEKLDNLQILTDARAAYNDLLVSQVEEKISQIGEVGLNSGSMIQSAREAYDTLQSELQPSVENYSRLTAAEKALLDARVEDVETAINAIDAIDKINWNSQLAIVDARDKFDRYSEEVQNAVSNYAVLVTAEETFVEMFTPKEIEFDNVIILDNDVVTVRLLSFFEELVYMWGSDDPVMDKSIILEVRNKSNKDFLFDVEDGYVNDRGVVFGMYDGNSGPAPGKTRTYAYSVMYDSYYDEVVDSLEELYTLEFLIDVNGLEGGGYFDWFTKRISLAEILAEN